MSNEPNQSQPDDGQGRSEDHAERQRREARAREAKRRETEDEHDSDESDEQVVEAEEGASLRSEDSEAEQTAEEESGDEQTAEEDSEAEQTAEEDSEAEQEEDREDEGSKYVDLSEQGEEWLAGLFERMNFDAAADFEQTDQGPHFDISGGDAKRLLGVGKLGPKAIEGVETLMQSVFSEDDGSRDLSIDVGGERAYRKEMLEGVADEMADKAVSLHKKLTVSGLNSTERRIIHRRLRDYDGVETESVGDGIFRRLTIEPTD